MSLSLPGFFFPLQLFQGFAVLNVGGSIKYISKIPSLSVWERSRKGILLLTPRKRSRLLKMIDLVVNWRAVLPLYEIVLY